ncbi:MAG: hypothetical protein J0I06_03885 [Planctomycetes bacterium]|nr:hypothetical protein [Planctomycetota bacterium]
MTRGVWAAVAVCAVGVGCNSPQYYTAPAEQLPQPVNIGGTTVQIVDQRPDWEKKPFTGAVCLYHLDKAHPGAWAQLADETNAVVAALPQKPERVEVAVTSFRLVRSGDTGKRYRDINNAPNVNPNIQMQASMRADDERREQQRRDREGITGATDKQIAADKPGNDIELLFASKDDPRRMLREHPIGASCSIQAKVRLVYPGGREQTVDVNAIARGANSSGTAYWGEAIDFAARTAVHQFSEQFRSGVGLGTERGPTVPGTSTAANIRGGTP